MASAMEGINTVDTGLYHGGMVAFEGPSDVVSTQLRLLPPSSQVLILPDLEHYMKRTDDKDFTVRSYVKDVHEAIETRHEVASKFLRDSSRDHKRLVFLNGGTAGAVSQCISAISHHHTSGDLMRAEMMLKEILREGVQGLDGEEKDCDGSALRRADSVGTRDGCPWKDEEIEEDPITKAMKAADALYEETDSLEPIECYIRTRSRSLSFPMPGLMDDMGQASPFFIFGPPPIEENSPESSTENEVPFDGSDQFSRRYTVRTSTQCSGMTIPMAYRPSSSMRQSCVSRSLVSIFHGRNRSSTSNVAMSAPTSPSEVEFGEARLVPMQASSKTAQTLRRTRSLDDIDMHRAHVRRRLVSASSPVPAAPIQSEGQGMMGPCRHLSILEDPFSNNNLIRLPRAKFVRANTTTIRKSPTPPKPPCSTTSNHRVSRHAKSEAEHDSEDRPVVVRDPVIPFREDLVIQFTGEVSNHILDSVVESLQTGLYPVSTLPVNSDGTAEIESGPSTPRTEDLFDTDDFNGGLSPVAEVPSLDECVDYDAMSIGGLSRASNFRFTSPCPSLPPEIQPPTPAHTPPILGAETEGKRSRFQVVSTIDRVNAIAIQNNLRSILDAQFPPEQDRRYRMSRFSLLPHMDKLWRPMFWNVGSKGRIPSQRTADLILAIGSQNSVKADFLSALTGQIEKLGSKSTGMTRSGRLDLRFLVANAMQSFTTISLASQLQENPFESPHLLACLIVPHLATYLSVNANIRFLILEYPAEHLATVVALQNLIGTDILKVAGIIDSEAASAYNTEPSSPISSFHSRRMSNTSTASASALQLSRSLDAINLPGSPFPHPVPPQSPPGTSSTLVQRRRLSFSKANYVLTNTATEAEIASFISTVWKLLIAADAFYYPEHGHHIGHRATSRYPNTKMSNSSLVSSKFAPTSTAPSTPLSPTPGAASSILNHPSHQNWGLAGPLLASPPSSRGSGADATEPAFPIHHPFPSSRHMVQRSFESHDIPYAPPSGPVPPPPSSRDESPSGTSFHTTRSSGRVRTGSTTSASGMGILGRGLTASPSGTRTSVSPSAVRRTIGHGPLHVSETGGSGSIPIAPLAGGFLLRSKSLNRILGSRRGRKPNVIETGTNTPTSSVSVTPFSSVENPAATPATVRDSLKMTARGAGGDAASEYAMSFADEGEFYDEEERRLMPMYMRQSEMRKVNSRKALKWLGLA